MEFFSFEKCESFPCILKIKTFNEPTKHSNTNKEKNKATHKNLRKKIQNEMERIKENINLWKSILIQQYQEATKKDISDFRNFFTNIFSLIIYPILGRKILTVLMGTNFKEYQEFLQGRKEEIAKLVPVLL